MLNLLRARLRGGKHGPFLGLNSCLVNILRLFVQLFSLFQFILHIVFKVQHHIVSIVRDPDVGLFHLLLQLGDLLLFLLLGLLLPAIVILLPLLQELHELGVILLTYYLIPFFVIQFSFAQNEMVEHCNLVIRSVSPFPGISGIFASNFNALRSLSRRSSRICFGNG